MAVTLGDIGKGVDEAAGGQRVGAHLQHAPVEQVQFQLLDGFAVGVAAVRGEQGQFALGHHLGEGPMGIDRRQAAEVEKAVVPQLQLALGIDHGHALGQVVHGALQQARLLRQGLLAAQGFVLLDLGDIGVEDHQPTLTGRPLADLHPAPVAQAIEHLLALTAALLLHHQAGALAQALDLLQPGARGDARAAVTPEGLEAAVEQHDALLAVEQDEAVADTFDGVDQVLVSGFRAQARIAEQLVAGFQLGHGLVQGIGAFAHLLGQHHRMLEGGVGIIAPGMGRFHPLDQRGVDPLEFEVVALKLRQARPQLGLISLGRGGQWRLR